MDRKGEERAREPMRFERPPIEEDLETVEPVMLDETAVADLGGLEEFEEKPHPGLSRLRP